MIDDGPQIYFLETAKSELISAEKCWNEKRIAKAQHHLREARYWAHKIYPEYTCSTFSNNLRELEIKITRGY